jgi:hypothetical protein
MSLFKTKMIKGRRAYKVLFDVEVHMGDKSGVLTFKVVSGGEEIGKIDLDFEGVDSLTSHFANYGFN